MYEADHRLRWHLRGNVFPPVTEETAIQGIAKAIEETAEGRGDEVDVANLTHEEIVDDLRLWDFVEELQ